MPFCSKCGTEVPESVSFCSKCGYALQNEQSNQLNQTTPLVNTGVENLSLFGYYTKCFKNYINFRGRARRKEYWGFALFYIIFAFLVTFIGGAISGALGDKEGSLGIVFYYIYLFILFLPLLAVYARRLHDTGKSGWWFLLNFTIIGGIVVFIWLCTEGDSMENEYGKNPKGIEAEKWF